MLPGVQLDTKFGEHRVRITRHRPRRPYAILQYLLILANNSLIKRERLSLHFICLTWRFFKKFAITVFNGTEKIMMATPTNAAHPRRLYSEMNASVTFMKRRIVRVTDVYAV